MSIGVSTEFIDLTDGEWHVLPSNAVNIVFEGFGGPSQSAEIWTSHNGDAQNYAEHKICDLSSSTSGNKDHFAINHHPGQFCLQKVRAVNNTFTKVRVFFGRAK